MTLSQERFLGGAAHRVIADSTLVLDVLTARVYSLDASVGSLHVTLPPANRIPVREGGPIFYLVNIGSNDIDVHDDGGSNLFTLDAGDTCVVLLGDESDADGDWYSSCSAHNVTVTGTPTGTTTTVTPTETTTTATTTSTTNPDRTSGQWETYIGHDPSPHTGEHMMGGGIMGHVLVEEGI